MRVSESCVPSGRKRICNSERLLRVCWPFNDLLEKSWQTMIKTYRLAKLRLTAEKRASPPPRHSPSHAVRSRVQASPRFPTLKTHLHTIIKQTDPRQGRNLLEMIWPL